MDSAQRWERIWELFDLALEQPGTEQEAWLAEACGSDEGLRSELQSLLSAHRNAEGILDNPVGKYASQALSEAEDPATRDEKVGPFRVLHEIGRGGMGVVYKAEDPRLGRFVALKFLPPSLTVRTYAKQRLVAEARAASKLDHPNICTIHDIGETPDGRTYLTMAYYEGRTLAARIADGPLTVEEAIPIIKEVARGLEHAHDAGVIHRDIKPSNILLTSKGEVRILDFGLAKRGLDSLTDPAMRLGTAYYMSPEQALGKQVDHRTDLWSLGVTLYEMVTGRTPFDSEDEPSVMYKIVHDEPEPLTEDPGEPLRGILAKLLVKDPEERYQRAGELLEDCQPPAVGEAVARPLSWRGVALAAVFSLVVITGLWIGLDGTAGPDFLEPVPLTSFAGREETATFSPDSTQIAFSWNGVGQDNFDIYLKTVDSPETLRLTDDPAWDSSPAWSPDGKRIVFLRERAEGTSAVVEIPRVGGPERVLSEIVASPRFGVSWSPDGREVAVPDRVSGEHRPEVVLIDVQRGEKRTLATAPPGAIEIRNPVFSPDGQTVAFDVLQGVGLGDTYLVPAGGGDLERLTFGGGEPEGLAWTPDSRHLLFARMSASGGRTMWIVPAAGGEPRQLAAGDNPSQPAVSPSGEWLVFSKRLSRYDVLRADATEEEPRRWSRFISSTQFDGNPQYSPDGSRMVFSSSRSGDVEIWICDADGSNIRQLTFLGVAGSPRWSPDGAWIAFDSVLDDNADIYVVGSSGGTPRRVTTNDAEDVVPGWSRDGKWIYFTSNRGGQHQIWRILSDGSPDAEERAVQVTTGGGFYGTEAPSGRVVLYGEKRSTQTAVWSVPVDGGEEAPVIEGLEGGWGNWCIAAGSIWFVNRRPEEGWAVFAQPLEDREAREIAVLPNVPTRGAPGLGVSPDGRWIVSGQVLVESDLMRAELAR